MLKKHMYHLMDSSPWPFIIAMNILLTAMGLACYMHSIVNGLFLFFLGLILLLFTMYVWWSDIISESTYQGNHTKIVQQGLKIGFILFIISEVMFFGGFFWAFFNSSLCPSIFLGSVWPPVNMIPLSPWGIPMLNTAMLLLSGLSMTWVHFAILSGDFMLAFYGFLITLFLAFFFTFLQIGEYFNSPFNISDSMYGTVFFSLTGLHGLHVIMGTIFIFVCFFSFMNIHYTTKHHLGFEFASWYWHFVDVVWLFLYLFVYIWGSW